MFYAKILNKHSDMLQKQLLKSVLIYMRRFPNISFTRHQSEYSKISIHSLSQRNIFTWIKLHWRISTLTHNWDREFSKDEFLSGTRQALVTITDLIHRNDFESLNGLIEKPALLKLKMESVLTWPKLLKDNIGIQHKHIISSELVDLRKSVENQGNESEKRLCEIDVLTLALKKILLKENDHGLLVINVFTSFFRDFSPGVIPEWTVTSFAITAAVLPPQPGLKIPQE